MFEKMQRRSHSWGLTQQAFHSIFHGDRQHAAGTWSCVRNSGPASWVTSVLVVIVWSSSLLDEAGLFLFDSPALKQHLFPPVAPLKSPPPPDWSQSALDSVITSPHPRWALSSYLLMKASSLRLSSVFRCFPSLKTNRPLLVLIDGKVEQRQGLRLSSGVVFQHVFEGSAVWTRGFL
jgi:hypothetical protein